MHFENRKEDTMQKIMFSEKYGLESAVLSKLKTMTRRIVPEKESRRLESFFDSDDWSYAKQTCIDDCARYKIGEVVAIAQRYSDLSWDATFYEKLKSECELLPQYELKGWNNKMFVKAEHMPHQIRIADIRIERLQDISDEDCLKEGIFIPDTIKTIHEIESHRYGWYDVDDKESEHIYCFDVYGKHPNRWHFPTPKLAFETLINKVSPKMEGKPMWDANPFVFVYSFELVK